MGILESLLDELITAETVHGALTIGISSISIVANSLVHHIPAVNDVLVTRDDSLDVILHAGIELLLGRTFGSHPAADLRVPHQGVTTQLDTVSTGKVGDAVGILPIELAFLRLGGLGLHVVLSGHAVELLLNQSCLLGIRHIALIDSDTNHEVVLIDILQTLCLD